MTSHLSPERRRHRLPSSPTAATSRRAPGDAAARLPLELIFEILSRVPVRSVCRFRCVSKGWRALLHDQIFIAAHKSLNAETFIVVISKHKAPGGGRELLLMDMDGKDVSVIKEMNFFGFLSASMDDLICVIDDFNDGPSVINPATGEVVVDCPKHDLRSWESWHIVFGFGRAIPSGTYKVLRFIQGRGCEVFSVGDGTGWRWAGCPSTDLYHERSSIVTVKGVMYFLATRELYADTLLCFDIESEEWTKAIESPQEIYQRFSWSITIAELNDTVCMAQVVPSDRGVVKIWLLKDSHKDIWIKAYTIPMADFTYDHCKPLGVTRDGGKLIFYSTVYGKGHALEVYDPYTGTCTTLRRLDDVADSISLWDPSLCSLLGPSLLNQNLEFAGAAEPVRAIS